MRNLADRAEPLRGRDERTGAIPPELWRQFLDDFSQLNQGTTARVEIVAPEAGGRRIAAEERPLLSVTLDDAAGAPQVVVECGDTAGSTPAALRHIIDRPTAVWAHEESRGRIDALEIESAGSGTTILTVNPHPGRGDLGLEGVGRSETAVP